MKDTPSIKDLYTRANSNKGIQLPIPLPNGKMSGYHFTVVGADSDLFQAAKTERIRQGPIILSMPEELRPAAIMDADIKLLSTAVIGWDFPDNFTRTAVEESLREAPHLFDYVNESIVNRGRFFVERSSP